MAKAALPTAFSLDTRKVRRQPESEPGAAETEKLIYQLFLQGLSPYAIGRKLTGLGIKSPAEKDTWHQSSVKSILTNEKYKGDALLQKQYMADFLTKKQKKNQGEIPQYYVGGKNTK